jgi:hypothetical protein
MENKNTGEIVKGSKNRYESGSAIIDELLNSPE